MWVRKIMVGVALVTVTGCSAYWDGYGVDPVDYNAQHPIKNTVETRTEMRDIYFRPSHLLLPGNAENEFRNQLNDISMSAVESITVGLSSHDIHSEARKTSIRKLIRHSGFSKNTVTFEAREDVADHHARLWITYTIVIPPECPGWGMSAVTTYSNTTQGNFYCSQETNTGLMVADPYDLVAGAKEVELPTSRASVAVQNYNNGAAAAAASTTSSSPSTSGSSSSGGSGSSAGAVAAPQ